MKKAAKKKKSVANKLEKFICFLGVFLKSNIQKSLKNQGFKLRNGAIDKRVLNLLSKKYPSLVK